MAVNMDKGKENKKDNTAPFSRAYSRLFLGLCRFVRVFLHGKCKQSSSFKEQKKSGPMLVLSNHLSAYDFIHFGAAMHGVPLNFVVAKNMMYSTPIFAKLIKSYHAITKRQYFADFQCVKNIKKYLDSGINVLLCPEGKVTADGVTGPITPSIARLVQWLGYPVGIVKMKGASLAHPKWAYNLRFVRRGNVYAECDMLFSAEQTKNLPRNEILKRICDALEHNEHKWQIDNDMIFKGRHYAEGLDRLLYRCPKCGCEFKMRTKGSILTCSQCHNTVKYRFDGYLEPIGDSVAPERIDLWCDEQRKQVALQVSKDNFNLQENVSLLVENATNNGYRFIAKGVLSLDKNKLCFDTNQIERPIGISPKYGVNNMLFDYGKRAEFEQVEEEFKHIEFSVAGCETVANLPGTAIDMYDERHVYRFMFDEVLAATKFALVIEETYKAGDAME